MKLSLPGYRVTTDDLPDADKKTQRALEPLLDGLNRALQLVIAALNTIDVPMPKSASFTSSASGVASVDLKLASTPSELWVSGLTPASGAITAVYAASWAPLTSGARVSFVGLAASMTYALKVRYL